MCGPPPPGAPLGRICKLEERAWPRVARLSFAEFAFAADARSSMVLLEAIDTMDMERLWPLVWCEDRSGALLRGDQDTESLRRVGFRELCGVLRERVDLCPWLRSLEAGTEGVRPTTPGLSRGEANAVWKGENWRVRSPAEAGLLRGPLLTGNTLLVTEGSEATFLKVMRHFISSPANTAWLVH